MGCSAKINKGITLFLPALLICCFACSPKPEQEKARGPSNGRETPVTEQHDAPAAEEQRTASTGDPIVRQAATLVASLKQEGDYGAGHGRDTLIDINGDGHRDLLIEYYGGSGTGFKYMADVRLFETRRNSFGSTRITLPNPTFYFDRKKVAVYYVGTGGGDAYTLQWKGNVPDTLEYITIAVDNSKKLPVFTTTIKKKTEASSRSMITSEVSLPSSYRYCRYAPLIAHSE